LTNAPNTVFSGQLHTRYRQNILAYHYQLKCTANFVISSTWLDNHWEPQERQYHGTESNLTQHWLAFSKRWDHLYHHFTSNNWRLDFNLCCDM